MIKLFFDVETTGVDHMKHSIHQISGIVEVDGEIAEEFDFKVRPHPKAQISKEALIVCNKTESEIMSYPEMAKIHKMFLTLLGKYVDKFNNKEKMYLIGFNNRAFDDKFLRMFFELNGDRFIGSWFWSDTGDVLCLASEYLMDRRASMPSFKLKRVAMEIGLEVDVDSLHDALFDARLTRSIYRIVTGIDIEL